jgi:hypothetical protein
MALINSTVLHKFVHRNSLLRELMPVVNVARSKANINQIGKEPVSL